MADLQPNQLNESTTTASNDVVVVQSNSTGQVNFVQLLNLIPTGGILPTKLSLGSSVQNYTPTVTAIEGGYSSGTAAGHYINLGGIKLCWGHVGGGNSTSSVANFVVSLPSSFLSTITMFLPSVSTVGNSGHQYVAGNGASTSSFGFYIRDFDGLGIGASWSVDWLIIGT